MKPYSKGLRNIVSSPIEALSKDSVLVENAIEVGRVLYGKDFTKAKHGVAFSILQNGVEAGIALVVNNTIEVIYVTPSFRGNGVATELVRDIKKHNTSIEGLVYAEPCRAIFKRCGVAVKADILEQIKSVSSRPADDIAL